MEKFILFVVIYSTVIFFVYISFFQRTIISNDLSDRAREYINSQRNKQTKFGKDVHLNIITPTQIIAKQPNFDDTIKTDCYIVHLPENVEKIDRLNACSLRIYVQKPRSYVTIHYKKADVNNIKEVSDVLMRSSKKEEYLMSEKQTNRYKYVTFQKNTVEYEKTGFLLWKSNSISISVVGISNENLDGIFNFILDSFILL